MGIKVFLLCMCLTLLAMPAQAFFGAHLCSQPSPPYDGAEQWEVDAFKDEVENYRRCIEDYVDEATRQKEDIERQAQDAKDEYNNFILSL